MSKQAAASIEKVAFNCPHCSAYTHQYWWNLYTQRLENELDTPISYKKVYEDVKNIDDINEASLATLKEYADSEVQRLVFTEDRSDSHYVRKVGNLYLSECFSCKKFSIWKDKQLLFPKSINEYQPNSDLPDEIKADYGEALEILNISPRGSAALLRLCIQKLCQHLGCNPKESINQNIAELLRKGLDTRVQKSLDIVRVIGNDAVHPGTLDLKDNTETAITLFGLVNIIADIMISQPKHIDEIYENLPPSTKEAIANRDKKAS